MCYGKIPIAEIKAKNLKMNRVFFVIYFSNFLNRQKKFLFIIRLKIEHLAHSRGEITVNVDEECDKILVLVLVNEDKHLNPEKL